MESKARYKVSILMIVKDEDLYLREFICYYLALGVDHFFVYDNGSAVPVGETLYAYLKYCTVIDFPGVAKQFEAYNHFIQHHSSETEWVAPIDIDEFIVLKNEKNIKDFLSRYAHIDCIAMNWRYFGDSFFDKRPEGLVMDHFIFCDEFQNPHIKNIVKTSAWAECKNAHHLGLKPGSVYSDVKGNAISGPFNENYTIDIVQVNHYFSKSKEECRLKYARGRASINEKFNVTEETLTSWRNSLNAAKDTFLRDHFSAKVKVLMEEHRNPVSVLMHIYYKDSIKEFSEKIGGIRRYVETVYINLVRENFFEFSDFTFPGNYSLVAAPNKGKDVGGKLVLMERYLIAKSPTKYLLFLHDKKSPQSPMSSFWSKNLFRIIEPEVIPQIIEIFEKKEDAGIVASSTYIRNEWNKRKARFDSPNDTILKELISQYQLTPGDYNYVAGTMFWCRSILFENFLAQHDALAIVKTLETGNIMDTETASRTHAWERMLSWICTSQNQKIYGV